MGDAAPVFCAVSLDEPAARALERRHVAELGRRYGGTGPALLDAAPFEPPKGCFLVVRVGDEAVACGGIRRLTPVVAELKCVYVAPAHRRRGIARVLLARLEAAASAAGYNSLRLEAGTGQPEALALYASAGYREIPPYGPFRDEACARCMAKPL